MTFLAPGALLGILLLAIPIIVHLFKPRKMKATPFSSLRWLRQAHQRMSRRIQWHQWLLFLVRAGVLLFLVLALARPLLGLGSGETDRIVLLDVGRTMAYKSPALPSPWESARDLAGKLLERPRPGQRTAVILAANKPRLLRPLVADASTVVPLLADMQPGVTEANLGAAMSLVEGLLRPDKRPAELIVLTDQHASSWQQPDVQRLVKQIDRPLKVQVIDVGPSNPTNAWIAGARWLSESSDRVILVEVGCAGDQSQPRSIRLRGITGLEEESLPVPLEPGKLTRVHFRLPGDLPLARQIAEIRLEPADNLPSDDIWYLPLDAAEKRILLIEPETPGSDGRPVGLFLSTGLQSLQTRNKGVLDVQKRTAVAVTAPDVRKADLVFLAGAADLSDTVLSTLEQQVRAGAGLVVFLGPNPDKAFVTNRLHRALQPAESLLPLAPAGASFVQRPAHPCPLAQVRWRHPVLAPLNDPMLGDLALGSFAQYVRLEGTPSKSDTILATFEDSTPAIVEHPLGDGRVLLFNTSANDDWTDLPRRNSFVPLLDRLLTYLARGGLHRPRTVGEPVLLTLEGWPADATIQLLSPSDKTLSPRIRRGKEAPSILLDEAPEPGIYRVLTPSDSERTARFAVNTSRGDSPLSPMDAKTFASWWDPATAEVLGADEAAHRWGDASWSWPLWPLLVFLVGLLLITETVYASWLCPRRNRPLAESVVHQRGLLRPLADKEPTP